MKKARLRIVICHDGKRITAAYDFTTIHLLDRALTQALPLLRGQGARLVQKTTRKQTALNLGIEDANGRRAKPDARFV